MRPCVCACVIHVCRVLLCSRLVCVENVDSPRTPKNRKAHRRPSFCFCSYTTKHIICWNVAGFLRSPQQTQTPHPHPHTNKHEVHHGVLRTYTTSSSASTFKAISALIVAFEGFATVDDEARISACNALARHCAADAREHGYSEGRS